ncbi:MAG: hypothetical protein AB7I30_10415 [Isosphaeraceae bacterium]
MTRRRLTCGLGLVFWALAGCSDTPRVSGSMEEATVKGVVRVQGAPVTNGMITFRASNVNRPNAPTKEAPIGKDGTYTINALVGQNFVEVSCKELFTPKNRPYAENERMVDVPSGEFTLDIDVPPLPTAPTP